MKKWNYWDGQIIKAKDGRYHLFASRWDQAKGHGEWWNSKAVHAVSDHLFGPYVDKGLCWSNDEGGRGHNVTALALPDGRYAIVVSETRPGTVYVSKSPDGPWKRLGTIRGEGLHASNISIMVRPDSDYMIVPREGQVFISKAADGILGPYKATGPSAYPNGIPDLEDPAIFYSGGLYHIIVNSWSTRKAYHLTSKDGKTHWVNRGLAYDPTTSFCRYTDGTVNHWHKLERPGVFLENGHVVAMTLAVLDTPKESQTGNNGHGSKIVVIPFDGAAMDRDLQASAGDSSSEARPGAKTINLNPASGGRVFEGVGAVGAGASSRLLIEYPEKQRQEVLDYLFKPNFGAGFQHLKVEIGGEVNSTDGTELTHMRSRNEEDYQRGYEWWLMKEAKCHNGNVILDCLAWGAPGWIGGGKYYSQDMADYVVKFLQGAKKVHGLDIAYTGIWNETPHETGWIKLLRRSLDAAGFQNTGIVGTDDGGEPGWKIVEEIGADPELRAAVARVGYHYPIFQSPVAARNCGCPLWASEDGPWRGDWDGAKQIARVLNRNYVTGKFTKTEIWSPVTSY